MTWGPYWFFYKCPECGKKFRYMLDDPSYDAFGVCPDCKVEGILVAESRDYPKDAEDYEYA